MKWIRIWTQETLQSTTFQELNDTEAGVWFKLLIIAGANIRNPGIIEMRDGVPYPDEMLATYLNSQLDHFTNAKKHLIDVEKLELLPDGRLKIKNFDKYQSRQLRYYHEHKNDTPNKRKKRRKVNFTGDKIREDKIREEYSSEERIFFFWNRLALHDQKDKRKTLLRSLNLTTKLNSILSARIKDHGFKDVRRAIWNYRQLLLHPRSRWTYRWHLLDFMTREKDNVERFKDWTVVEYNFLKPEEPKKIKNPLAEA